MEFDLATLRETYEALPGGPKMLRWFGQVPSFHDGEIVSLHLNRRSPSFLKVSGWVGDGTSGSDGYLKSLKRAVVTFALDGISYLEVDGFSSQNVIHGLMIARRPKDPERRPYYDFNATDGDYELHLEHCYGMSGIIRCAQISITLVPGRPEDDPEHGE
jgi:hypothetical protein